LSSPNAARIMDSIQSMASASVGGYQTRLADGSLKSVNLQSSGTLNFQNIDDMPGNMLGMFYLCS